MGNTDKLLRDIEAEIRYTRSITGRDAFDPGIIRAMTEVPRHEFVPGHEQAYAYSNGPLPIGHGQTISQPFIVALMTDLLACDRNARVLEVGTGSGYQAAVLSRVVGQVFSVEIVSELAQQASERLARLGYGNVECCRCDGYEGWPERAPFDGILVTAAAPSIPPPLVEQLRGGARMVIPIGPQYGHQELMVVEKLVDGTAQTAGILGVAFVPLTRARADQVSRRVEVTPP